MLSPVCTPIGSRFSIEHTIIELSDLSRTTSNSNSFQPISDSSTKVLETGLRSIAFLTLGKNSSLLKTIPPPVPPRV